MGLFEQKSNRKTIEENYNEEYFINILSELFKLNPEHGQLINADRNFQSTNQSSKKVSKTSPETTNAIASSKKITPYVESKDFKPERTQPIVSICTNHKSIDKVNNFDFMDLKTERTFDYEYYHC